MTLFTCVADAGCAVSAAEEDVQPAAEQLGSAIRGGGGSRGGRGARKGKRAASSAFDQDQVQLAYPVPI